MNKIVFRLLMVLVLILNLNAQPKSGEGIIKGRILESEDNKPLAYVNILLYKVGTEKMVSGTMSGNDGYFTIDKVPFGNYYIIVKMIGYEKQKYNHIEIKPGHLVHNIGEIKLDLTSLISEGVEVVAEKPLMEYKVDKKVINVSRDIVSQGGSAVTVLENSPSVQVDIEGNVSLRGSSNFTVYINNKPSIIQGSDALEQIPASSIESIEIITNPSAKYDPDGVSGIINVILKENSNNGTAGLIDLSIGTRDKYSGNLLLNQKFDGFGVIAGVNYRDDNRYADGESQEIFRYLNPVKEIYSDVDGGRNHNSFKLKGGFEFDFNRNSSLTIQGEYGGFGFKRTHYNNRYQSYGLMGLDSFFVNDNEIVRDMDFYGIMADYFLKFSKPGHQLTASIRFSRDKGSGDNKQIDYISNYEWQKLAPSSYNVWSDETEDEKELRMQIDYTLPFSEETKFEAGYQSRINKEVEEYTLRILQNNQWEIQPEFNNAMDFSRAIHSIYSTYTDKIGDFGFNIGLRGEYTLRTVGVQKENHDYTIDRFDYFPTLHLSYNLTQNTQLMASYTKRIDRPRGWELEPSVMYMDANSYRIGNPALEPEYIHSYEFGVIKYWGTSYISLESYYRLNNNKITRIREIRDDDKIYYTTTNLKNDETLGLEFTANYEPFKFIRLNLSSSYYNYKLQGSVFDSSVTQETNSWNANFNITYMLLSTNTRFQLQGFYIGPSVTAQGERKESYSINFAIRQELLQKQLSLTLQVRDIFGTMKREYLTDTRDLYTYDIRYFESPVISLSVTYHINNYREKNKNGSFEGGGDSEFEM